MSLDRRWALVLLVVLAVPLVTFAIGTPVPPFGDSTELELTRTWLSETGREASGNHHAATGARFDGQGRVFAPISGGVHDHPSDDGSTGHHHDGAGGGDHHGGERPWHDGERPRSSCGLYALDGSTGSVDWQRTVPPANCSIHAIADPTVADVTAESGPEVLATSTTNRLRGARWSDGTTVLSHPIAAHGYTRPVVANVTADPGPEILAVDVHGNATLLASERTPGDGPERAGGAGRWSPRWSVALDGFVWAEPQVRDLTGDGRAEVAIALADGRMAAIRHDGTVAWTRSVLADADGLTWATTVETGDATGPSIVAASSGGTVVRVDGDSEIAWQRELGAYAAVRATRDAGDASRAGDAGGPAVVYATNRAGELYALDGETGETRWKRTLTDADVQMTPPPSIGDVAGGPAPEVVAVTNDGRVRVIDPSDGSVLARGGRSAPIFTHAALVDLDRDPHREIVVTYGDGRIARFDASREE